MSRRHYGSPSTIRLTPGARHMLATYATVERISRSEMLRRLLAEGMTAHAVATKPPKPADVMTSAATGRRHLVTIELDVPRDDDPDAIKEMVAVRNSVLLNGVCADCGATMEVPVEPPRIPVRATTSAAVPVAVGAGQPRRLGRVVPSTSPPTRRRAGKSRATIHAVVIHAANCRGAMP